MSIYWTLITKSNDISNIPYVKIKDNTMNITISNDNINDNNNLLNLSNSNYKEIKNIIFKKDDKKEDITTMDEVITYLKNYIINNENIKLSTNLEIRIDNEMIINDINMIELINYCTEIKRSNLNIKFIFDHCSISIAKTLFEIYKKKSNNMNKYDISYTNNCKFLVKDISKIQFAKYSNSSFKSILISPKNKEYDSVDLTSDNINKIMNVEINNLSSLESIILLLQYVNANNNLLNLILDDMKFNIDEFQTLMSIIKRNYRNIYIKCENCYLIKDHFTNEIKPNNEVIISAIYKYFPNATIAIENSKNNKNNKNNNKIPNGIGNVQFGGIDLNEILSQLNDLHNPDIETNTGVDRESYKPRNNNDNNDSNESNKPIAIRTTPKGKIAALNDKIASGEIDNKNLQFMKQFAAKNSVLANTNNNQSAAHQNGIDLQKLEILLSLPTNLPSILKYFKNVQKSKQKDIILNTKKNVEFYLRNIFSMINFDVKEDFAGPIISSYLDLIFSEFTTPKTKKLLACGTPGNGKTTGFTTQGWFIMFRDILVYNLKKMTNLQNDPEKYEKKIQELCASIYKEITHLINLGNKIHSNPNYFCAYYIALIPCQNIQEVLDMQGSSNVYVGANLGTFMKVYSDVGGDSFDRLYRVTTGSNNNMLSLTSEMINDSNYISSSRAIIFDETDKFPKKNGESPIANTLTKLLEEGTLEHTFTQANISFAGSPICCTANDDKLIPAHIKDRSNIIQPGNWSDPIREKMFTKKVSQLLEADDYQISQNENGSIDIKLIPNNWNSKLTVETGIYRKLSQSNLETYKGSLRKLTDNALRFSKVVIDELYKKSPLNINFDKLNQLLPELIVSPNINIITTENMQNSMMFICPSLSGEELKPVTIKIAITRQDIQNQNEQILGSLYTVDRNNNYQKDHYFSYNMMGLLKSSPDSTYQFLNKITTDNSIDFTKNPISLVAFKDAIASVLSKLKRVVVSLGNFNDELPITISGNVTLLILLILLARELNFNIPVNLCVVGEVDILGSVILNTEFENTISSKLAALQGSINKENLYVLLPTKKLIGSELNSYIVRNMTNINAHVYNIDDIVDMVQVTFSLYLKDLAISNPQEYKKYDVNTIKYAEELLARKEINCKSIIENTNIARGLSPDGSSKKQ